MVTGYCQVINMVDFVFILRLVIFSLFHLKSGSKWVIRCRCEIKFRKESMTIPFYLEK